MAHLMYPGEASEKVSKQRLDIVTGKQGFDTSLTTNNYALQS